MITLNPSRGPLIDIAEHTDARKLGVYISAPSTPMPRLFIAATPSFGLLAMTVWTHPRHVRRIVGGEWSIDSFIRPIELTPVRSVSHSRTHVVRRSRMGCHKALICDLFALSGIVVSYHAVMNEMIASIKRRTQNLEWNSELTVGIVEMDEQHISLFALYNDVCAALEEKRGQDIIEPLLNAFFDQTRAHFNSEEALLRSVGFPGLLSHTDLHRDLDTLLKEYMRRFRCGYLGSEVNLLSFLRQWLVRHIQREDKEYGSWLSARGIH